MLGKDNAAAVINEPIHYEDYIITSYNFVIRLLMTARLMHPVHKIIAV